MRISLDLKSVKKSGEFKLIPPFGRFLQTNFEYLIDNLALSGMAGGETIRLYHTARKYIIKCNIHCKYHIIMIFDVRAGKTMDQSVVCADIGVDFFMLET